MAMLRAHTPDRATPLVAAPEPLAGVGQGQGQWGGPGAVLGPAVDRHPAPQRRREGEASRSVSLRSTSPAAVIPPAAAAAGVGAAGAAAAAAAAPYGHAMDYPFVPGDSQPQASQVRVSPRRSTSGRTARSEVEAHLLSSSAGSYGDAGHMVDDAFNQALDFIAGAAAAPRAPLSAVSAITDSLGESVGGMPAAVPNPPTTPEVAPVPAGSGVRVPHAQAHHHYHAHAHAKPNPNPLAEDTPPHAHPAHRHVHTHPAGGGAEGPAGQGSDGSPTEVQVFRTTGNGTPQLRPPVALSRGAGRGGDDRLRSPRAPEGRGEGGRGKASASATQRRMSPPRPSPHTTATANTTPSTTTTTTTTAGRLTPTRRPPGASNPTSRCSPTPAELPGAPLAPLVDNIPPAARRNANAVTYTLRLGPRYKAWNLYFGPDVASGVFASMPEGTEIEAVEEVENWLRLTSMNAWTPKTACGVGWIQKAAGGDGGGSAGEPTTPRSSRAGAVISPVPGRVSGGYASTGGQQSHAHSQAQSWAQEQQQQQQQDLQAFTTAVRAGVTPTPRASEVVAGGGAVDEGGSMTQISTLSSSRRQPMRPPARLQDVGSDSVWGGARVSHPGDAPSAAQGSIGTKSLGIPHPTRRPPLSAVPHEDILTAPTANSALGGLSGTTPPASVMQPLHGVSCLSDPLGTTVGRGLPGSPYNTLMGHPFANAAPSVRGFTALPPSGAARRDTTATVPVRRTSAGGSLGGGIELIGSGSTSAVGGKTAPVVLVPRASGARGSASEQQQQPQQSQREEPTGQPANTISGTTITNTMPPYDDSKANGPIHPDTAPPSHTAHAPHHQQLPAGKSVLSPLPESSAPGADIVPSPRSGYPQRRDMAPLLPASSDPVGTKCLSPPRPASPHQQHQHPPPSHVDGRGALRDVNVNVAQQQQQHPSHPGTVKKPPSRLGLGGATFSNNNSRGGGRGLPGRPIAPAASQAQAQATLPPHAEDHTAVIDSIGGWSAPAGGGGGGRASLRGWTGGAHGSGSVSATRPATLFSTMTTHTRTTGTGSDPPPPSHAVGTRVAVPQDDPFAENPFTFILPSGLGDGGLGSGWADGAIGSTMTSDSDGTMGHVQPPQPQPQHAGVDDAMLPFQQVASAASLVGAPSLRQRSSTGLRGSLQQQQQQHRRRLSSGDSIAFGIEPPANAMLTIAPQQSKMSIAPPPQKKALSRGLFVDDDDNEDDGGDVYIGEALGASLTSHPYPLEVAARGSFMHADPQPSQLQHHQLPMHDYPPQQHGQQQQQQQQQPSLAAYFPPSLGGAAGVATATDAPPEYTRTETLRSDTAGRRGGGGGAAGPQGHGYAYAVPQEAPQHRAFSPPRKPTHASAPHLSDPSDVDRVKQLLHEYNTIRRDNVIQHISGRASPLEPGDGERGGDGGEIESPERPQHLRGGGGGGFPLSIADTSAPHVSFVSDAGAFKRVETSWSLDDGARQHTTRTGHTHPPRSGVGGASGSLHRASSWGPLGAPGAGQQPAQPSTHNAHHQHPHSRSTSGADGGNGDGGAVYTNVPEAVVPGNVAPSQEYVALAVGRDVSKEHTGLMHTMPQQSQRNMQDTTAPGPWVNGGRQQGVPVAVHTNLTYREKERVHRQRAVSFRDADGDDISFALNDAGRLSVSVNNRSFCTPTRIFANRSAAMLELDDGSAVCPLPRHPFDVVAQLARLADAAGVMHNLHQWDAESGVSMVAVSHP